MAYAYDSTVYLDSAYYLPSASLPGTECALDLPLMSILDDDAICDLPRSSSSALALGLGEPWPVVAPPAPSTDSDFHHCAPNAFCFRTMSTRDNICGHPHHSHYFPQPVPSPTTSSTESFSSFSIEHFFDDPCLLSSPVGYSGVSLPSPVTRV
jgi:hypothetical protein